jgi:hypothetical protein
LGTGFPASRGGLLRFAAQQGARQVEERLAALARRYGESFKPHSDLPELLAIAGENRA